MSGEEGALLEILGSIGKKIDVLTKVVTASAFDEKEITKSIAVLLRFGMESKEIAQVLGIKSNIVRSVKSRVTKKIRKKKPSASSKRRRKG